MGLNPTGPYYKGFTFDGDSSKDYGVFLTGEGVFNAPERSVEEITVPGRNGNYILDLGRFENISVTYKAGLVDYNEADFADRISAVRNWLCSKVGYQRLEDEYNPGEYRLAAYKNGVELEHFDLKTGEFSITFNCKPQRWLTSGETAVAVANNGTLTNPELFDSEPLLAVKGYGDIDFNGYEVSLQNVQLGYIVLFDSTQFLTTSHVFEINPYQVNVGDSIQIAISSLNCKSPIYVNDNSSTWSFDSATATDSNASFTSEISKGNRPIDIQKDFNVKTSVDVINISVGTDLTVTNTVSVTAAAHSTNKPSFGISMTVTQTIVYDSSASTITFTVSIAKSSTYNKVGFSATTYSNTVGEITANSTASALGNPTYIDCEIGECWMVSGGTIISLNGVISLGSDLPKLAPGSNTFTYDNTITELKVTPRWWKV